MRWIGLAVLITLLIIILGNALRSSLSNRKPQEQTVIGKNTTFEGVVSEVGESGASGRPWFRVVGDDGRDVKCYKAAPVRPRDYVHVVGTITVWDSSGGSLDPCAIVGRER